VPKQDLSHLIPIAQGNIMADALWTQSLCECLDCGAEWIGAHPVGADHLRCKACPSFNTVRFDHQGPCRPPGR